LFVFKGYPKCYGWFPDSGSWKKDQALKLKFYRAVNVYSKLRQKSAGAFNLVAKMFKEIDKYTAITKAYFYHEVF
jgi:hypothetical protein